MTILNWSVKFQTWLRTDQIFNILNSQSEGDVDFTDWSAGGCLLLATALAEALPGAELQSIATEEIPINHVVTCISTHYIDADGVFTKAGILEAQNKENRSLCTINAYDAGLAFIWDIHCPPVKLHLLKQELAQFLTENPFPTQA